MENRKLRILFITGEPAGGIRKHVHSILLGLDGELFELFYCHSSRGHDISFSREIDAVDHRLAQRLQMHISKNPAAIDILNILKLINVVRKNKIDIIHGHGAKAGIYARILSLCTRAKSIYTPHGGILHDSFSKLQLLLFRSIEKVLAPVTNGLTFESYFIFKKYCSVICKPKGSVLINYNGVSNAAEVSIEEQQDCILVFLAD